MWILKLKLEATKTNQDGCCDCGGKGGKCCSGITGDMGRGGGYYRDDTCRWRGADCSGSVISNSRDPWWWQVK